MNAMILTINGDERRFEGDALTVEALLVTLGFADRRVAVEVNRAIVKRATYGDHPIADGDVVEIVQFVGGG